MAPSTAYHQSCCTPPDGWGWGPQETWWGTKSIDRPRDLRWNIVCWDQQERRLTYRWTLILCVLPFFSTPFHTLCHAVCLSWYSSRHQTPKANRGNKTWLTDHQCLSASPRTKLREILACGMTAKGTATQQESSAVTVLRQVHPRSRTIMTRTTSKRAQLAEEVDL